MYLGRKRGAEGTSERGRGVLLICPPQTFHPPLLMGIFLLCPPGLVHGTPGPGRWPGLNKVSFSLGKLSPPKGRQDSKCLLLRKNLRAWAGSGVGMGRWAATPPRDAAEEQGAEPGGQGGASPTTSSNTHPFLTR